MLKSFLQLDLNSKHNKSQYSIKKNKLILIDKKYSSTNQRISKLNKPMLNNNNNPKQSSITNNNNQINFDCITYDPITTNQKILYEFLMLQPKQQQNQFNQLDNLQSTQKSLPVISMTITFNYDLQYENLQDLFIQLTEIKKFQSSQFKIAHFQLRNNHISDYNKTQHTQRQFYSNNDQMDTFTKQIDTCIKLDKTWRIKENIKFKQFTKNNFKQKDILNKTNRTNYDKKTNEFFICQIKDKQYQYQLNIIIFHRQKDFVLTRTQQKQIQQALILQRHYSIINQLLKKNPSTSRKQNKRINIQFNSSLVQIIQSYLVSSDQIIFISKYPNMKNVYTLSEVLYLPIKIGSICSNQVEKIIQFYNKQQENKIQNQMHRMKVKLRELHHKRKTTFQNIQYLQKKYKKGFQNIFDSLSYLKKNNINDIYSFKSNIQTQVKQKTQQIEEQIKYLQNINQQMIQSQQRNIYFKQKMQKFKQHLQQDLDQIDADVAQKQHKRNLAMKQANQTIQNQSKSTKKSTNQHKAQQKQNLMHSFMQHKQAKMAEVVLSQILQAYDKQQKDNPYTIQLRLQVQRYQHELREKTRERLHKSNELSEFKLLMEDLKKKLNKMEFLKIEQKYLGLISMF